MSEIVHIGIGSTIYTWEFENLFLKDKDYFVHQTEFCLPLWKVRGASKEMYVPASRMETLGILRYINYKDPVEYIDPRTREKEYITVWGIVLYPPITRYYIDPSTWKQGVVYCPYIPLIMTTLP